MVQSKNLTLSFSSESSIEEELKRESTADAITILVKFFLLIETKLNVIIIPFPFTLWTTWPVFT